MFSNPSLWTMLHGIGLSGAALMAMAAALFYLYAQGRDGAAPATPAQARAFAHLTVLVAAALWLAVLVGTFIIFPMYRATPPEGVTDLTNYPRALIVADAQYAWLHGFAMEIKEHVPWLAAMIATSIAFVAERYRTQLLDDARIRTMTAALLGIACTLVSAAGLLGILINKFAPLE